MCTLTYKRKGSVKSMKRNIEDLTTELIRLPKRERLEIVRFLLFLDNRSLDSEDIDSAWEQEITDRIRAVDNGTAIGIDYDQAMQTIE
jgi:hypothetical protein